MTSERDIDRILDHWFTERPTEVPDRVLDEVADRIGRQPQQPAWLTLWRDSHVNTYLKYTAAVAAVILVAVVGLAVLRPSSGPSVGGGTATPSPSPVASPSPSTSPSMSAVFPPWYPQASDGAGILPAGTQTTKQFQRGTTFTVPDGWVNDVDALESYGLFPDSAANEAEYARSQRIAQGLVMMRVDTPWLICEGIDTRGSSAAELVDSVASNAALTTSEPVDVTIGGLSGRQIDFQIDPAWTGSCPLRQGDPPTMDYREVRDRAIFLDAPSGGIILILLESLSSDDFAPLLADAMPIVESLRFDFAQ